MIETVQNRWHDYRAAVEADTEQWRAYNDDETIPDPPADDPAWLNGILGELLHAAGLAYRVQRLRRELESAEAELTRPQRVDAPALPAWCEARRRDVLPAASPWRAYLPRRARPRVTGRRLR